MIENEISDFFSQSIPEIMDKWETRAKKEIITPRAMSSLALRDSLPAFLVSMSIMLSTKKWSAADLEINANRLISIAKEHGRERAIKFAYIMSQVILEYHILRQVIFEILEEKRSISKIDRDIIISAIEEATNVAASEFALALAEAQNQFLFTLTHDLKTPITSTKALAELIARAYKADIAPGLAGRIIDQMNSMSEMINDLLNAGRIEAGEWLSFNREKCDIYTIALDAIKDMKSVYGDSFVLIAEGPVLGLWNCQYLRRIIENLINNAVKFRSPGTPVTITIKQTEDLASIDVHNLGEVIPKESQSVLFRPFRQIKTANSQKGWGLGLNFVKGAVNSLGGEITIESSLEKGTTFTITLPKGDILSLVNKKKL